MGEVAITLQTAVVYLQNNGTTGKQAWLLHFVGESVNDIFDRIPDNGTRMQSLKKQ